MKFGILLQLQASYLGVLLYTFALILLFFLLMNLDRRFREYIGRSVFRPFNFFADIRDRRLIPNMQTVVLSFVCSGALGIFLATLLTGFGSHEATGTYYSKLMPLAVYSPSGGFHWSFGTTVIVTTCVMFIGMVFIAAMLRFWAMFVRGRYYFAETYNISVWSLQPLSFLLIFDLTLPRMDMDRTTASVSLVILAAMTLWCYFRLLKGTGVLFDIYPTKIYGYGILFLAIVAGAAYLFL
ncbi:MAG TPA: hypothetical protein VGM92_04175 [Candidatus Kapabacteria bacterium]